jgi:arylsulfatase A-like enzyme
VTRTAALLALVVASASGCTGGAPAPATPARPALLRLLPALGPATRVRFQEETRPALLLRPGEERSCTVEVEAGSQLAFAWAVGPRSPAAGFVDLQVSAGAETIYRRRLAIDRRRRWWPVSVALAAHGPVKLTFRGDHVHASGRPVETNGKPPDPWIVVASPRIEGAPAAAGRVLLWISQDTVRADHLGAYGYPRRTSPHFDQRAREWVFFADAAATASWTLPSLASQFTSRYPLFHGATREGSRRDEGTPTVFEALAGAGFTVLGVTANDFVSSYFGMANGFDVLRYTGGEGPEGRQRAEDVTRLVLQTLSEWRGGDLAVFAHYMDPHYPYDPPDSYARLFPDDGSDTGAGGGPRAGPEALYDGELAYTDSQIDLLLKEMEGRGLLRDAVIAYTADHGEEFLDHGGWKHSRTLYQEMLHVPLALRLPGVGGRRITETVSLVDLAPTLLGALGVPTPASFQGRSLLPLVRGEALPPRELFAETERNLEQSHRLAVQLGSVKYILLSRTGRPDQRLSEELYDLAADAAERRSDLTRPEAENLRRIATAYLLRGREEQPSGRVEMPPEVKERLRALGYLR